MLVGLVFFSTYIEYNLSIMRVRLQTFSHTSKSLWMRRENAVFLASIGISLLACVCFFSRLAFATQMVFALATLLAWLYVASFESGMLEWNGLRRFGVFKLAIIAGVWTTVTLVLPALESGIPLMNMPFALLVLKRLCFLIAITLPFDARDEMQDRISGVRTLAVLYGAKAAITLSRFFLIVFIILGILSNTFKHPTSALVDLLPAAVAAVLIFQTSGKATSDLYYMALDGTLLIMAFSAFFTF